MSSKYSKQPSESVIEAIMKNDVARLKQLREAGEDFTCRDENHNTLLHLVILSKDTRKWKKSCRKFDKTHLTRAEVFRYLLTLNETDKEATNNEINTALTDIFMYLPDSQDWAIEFIKSGCNTGMFCGLSSALHSAITNDWYEVAELLIENGFEIDKGQYFNRETPLRLACELGRVDLIWMLLFYGADPNRGRCFDLAFAGPVQSEVQEIFESLVGYKKVFYLETYINAMEKSPEVFYKLCDASDSIRYSRSNLYDLASRLQRLRPELFKIFVQRYDYVIRHMFEKLSHFDFSGSREMDKNELDFLIRNICTLLESDINFCNSYGCNSEPRLLYFVSWFIDHDELDLVTQIILFVLSYGFQVPTEILIRIYYKFGYCSLFKMLLYMDISEINIDYLEIIPRIFYDVSSTPQELIRYVTGCVRNLHLISGYFTLPKPMKYCLVEDLKYSKRMKRYGHYRFHFIDEKLIERAKKLPDVPKLVELARNKAREFIIDKYKIQSCGQFYTIIKWLPIANIYKEILTYQRKLYE